MARKTPLEQALADLDLYRGTAAAAQENLQIAKAQLEAERSAVAGLSEQLERERQVTAQVAERANAAEIAAAELKGGIKAIQAATFALLGEMSFGGGGS